jgi:hypothetical protein
MSEHESARDPIAERFTEGTLMDEAMRKAVADAILRHRQLGLPIAVWRDGKVVWIPPEELAIPSNGNET